MINVLIDEKPYSIQWRYTYGTKLVPSKLSSYYKGASEEEDRSNIIETSAILHDENHEQVGMATVVKYHKDKSDKELARRYSLTKLISSLSIESRKHIWDVYNNRKSKSRGVESNS